MKTTHSLNALSVGILTLTLCGCDAPPMKSYALPGLSSWLPREAPSVPANAETYAATTAFRTLHGNSYNADEVTLAYAPAFEQGWVSETHLYVPEGPTFDEQGNLYFSPLLPPENVLLVSLDHATGTRRWAITGKREGSGGAPLVLPDPQHPQQQLIYSGSYERVMAVSTDGNVLWDKPTGLTASNDNSALLATHNYGVNFIPQQNALVSITGDGHIIALNRDTGDLLLPPVQIPGAPAETSSRMNLPSGVIARADALLAPLFDPDISTNGSLVQTLTAALLGDGAVISNYFAADPNTGTLWIAATAPDTADGVADGTAAYGALYAYRLEHTAQGYALNEQCHVYYPGGSASTPTLSGDGQRIYIGDSYRSLLAIDTGCQTIWKLDVGSQIVGSVAVSQDNHEIYASTGLSVIKVIDEGNQGRTVWKAAMDMFKTRPGQTSGNLNIAGVGANGVMIQVGAGFALKGQLLPLSVGVALLDRDTGKVRYATPGAEETVSVMSSNEDGALYLGHSPFRHALALALTGKKTPLLGGVAQYRQQHTELLVRDASCAAAGRLQNPVLSQFTSLQQQANQQQVSQLITEALQAIPTTQWDDARRNTVTLPLQAASASLASHQDVARDALVQACTLSQ